MTPGGKEFEVANIENELGQEIGANVPGWTPRPPPPRTAMAGRLCVVGPLAPDRHAADLFAAFAADAEARNWTYLSIGPFAQLAEFRAWAEEIHGGDDPLFHAIVERASGRALGVASFLRIEPATGVIEVGNLNFSPALQRTAIATEAMYLMMRRAFDELGYRRYEWKCDALNAPSRRAAERLGFVFEGIFRQATIYKGRNRDTAWYAVIDSDWPALRAAFETWLSPDNFDAKGVQRRSLTVCRAQAAGDG